MPRIQTPDLRDADGNRIVPRTLLQTITLTGAQNTVELTLPASPWKRFTIEIDDMAAVQNQVGGRVRLRMNGAVRAGASDYAFNVQGKPSNAGVGSDISDASSYIWLTRNDNGLQFGDQNNEAYSFELRVDPGVDAGYLPKIWGEGMGLSDSPRGVGISVYGIYRGVTSQEFGRCEAVEFSMDADNIARGEFRLYGTE